MNDDITGVKSTLAATGAFIKDHGIAIFLVVFFVIVIYPEQAQERKEWIIQITELQDSLDPSKRPVSADQAEIILDLVTDVFVQSIESTMQTELIWFQRESISIGGGYIGDTNMKRINLLGTEFKIDMSEDVDVQAKKEFGKYTRAIKKRKISLRQDATLALEKSTRSARHATAGLRSFVYASGTLSNIWESAFSATYSDFSNSLILSYTNAGESGFNRDRFVDFLEETGAEIPAELLEVNNRVSSSLVIFEFRKDIRKEWKNLINR